MRSNPGDEVSAGAREKIAAVARRLLEDAAWEELRREHGAAAVSAVRASLRALAERRNAYRLYCDGGSHGNPGPSGAGGVILDEGGREVDRYSVFLGIATNNQAEYRALLEGLARLLRIGAEEAEIFLDSELLVNQLDGRYRVRSPELAPLHREARERIARLRECRVVHIPREENREADRLAQQAIAGARGGRGGGGSVTL
ncbi:MAG: ribonuclease HI family protein [Candidatus Eisenbacteria bacterium]|nr:ribonuclease HI family protein [Candidatus Eisenbacteria bacterium]